MWRYKIIRFTRAIRIALGGGKEMEGKHYMFTLPRPLAMEQIARKLRPYGYYYNLASTTYRNQIYTVRKLLDLDHQYHLRFYDYGGKMIVTGHYELQPSHALDHLDGVELRSLTKDEIEAIWSILCPNMPLEKIIVNG